MVATKAHILWTRGCESGAPVRTGECLARGLQSVKYMESRGSYMAGGQWEKRPRVTRGFEPSRATLQALLGDSSPQGGEVGGVFLGVGVADLAFVVDAALHQIGRSYEVSLLRHFVTNVPACNDFAATVADLAGEDE